MLFTNSIKFPNMFSVTVGNTDIETQYTSINRCIALLLTTAKGELLGDPNFGCTLYERLFDPFVDTKKDIIINEIIDSINKYEKRVSVDNTDINIERSPDNEHRYLIHITYKLRNSDLTNTTYVNIDRRSE